MLGARRLRIVVREGDGIGAEVAVPIRAHFRLRPGDRDVFDAAPTPQPGCRDTPSIHEREMAEPFFDTRAAPLGDAATIVTKPKTAETIHRAPATARRIGPAGEAHR
jgi:hypothetical protein